MVAVSLAGVSTAMVPPARLRMPVTVSVVPLAMAMLPPPLWVNCSPSRVRSVSTLIKPVFVTGMFNARLPPAPGMA